MKEERGPTSMFCYCHWSSVQPHQTKHQEHLILVAQNNPTDMRVGGMINNTPTSEKPSPIRKYGAQP